MLRNSKELKMDSKELLFEQTYNNQLTVKNTIAIPRRLCYASETLKNAPRISSKHNAAHLNNDSYV